MSKNKPSRPVWIASVAVPGGARELLLDATDAAKYDADPDAFAARHFGLSKIQYLQWVDLDGEPLCGHRTRTGDLCRNPVGRSQLRAADFKSLHRKAFCGAHGKTGKPRA